MNKLRIQMFSLYIIVIFLIISILLLEYSNPLTIKRIDNRLTDFYNRHYNLKDTKLNETIYIKNKRLLKKGTYIKRITNIYNKDLYFEIKYKKHYITSNYNYSYKKGKIFLSNYLDKISKTTKNKLTLSKTLDELTRYRTDLLKGNNIKSIPFYNMELLIKDVDYNPISIKKEIIKKIDTSYNPNKYIIKIKKASIDLTIYNISYDIIKNDNFINILYDIMEKKESNLLKENNITYKYS